MSTSIHLDPRTPLETLKLRLTEAQRSLQSDIDNSLLDGSTVPFWPDAGEWVDRLTRGRDRVAGAAEAFARMDDDEKGELEVTTVPPAKGGRTLSYHIHRRGTFVGLLTTEKDTATGTYPWRIYAPARNPQSFEAIFIGDTFGPIERAIQILRQYL